MPGDRRCCQLLGVDGTEFDRMNHSTTGFTEECLHPVARSSISLPGIEDNRIWHPAAITFAHCHCNYHQYNEQGKKPWILTCDRCRSQKVGHSLPSERDHCKKKEAESHFSKTFLLLDANIHKITESRFLVISFLSEYRQDMYLVRKETA
jgi:hypothetical protein